MSIRCIVLAALAVSSITTANAETYNCKITQFFSADREANEKPWEVQDGKIVLWYHGDLAPSPPMSLPIVKDDADQLVAMRYDRNQDKGPHNTEMLIIDKRGEKVDFFNLIPGSTFLDHYIGSCAKP